MGGMLMWVAWVICLRGWYANMSYMLGMLAWKLAGNEYCSKLEKEFKFQSYTHFQRILFFRVLPEYLNLKLFQSCFQNRFRTLAYSEPKVH